MNRIPHQVTAATIVPDFQYDLLDYDDNVIGEINGVEGGQLQHSAATTVRSGGSLEIVDLDDIDWLHARVKITRSANDLAWPRGIYVPSVPVERIVEGERIYQVELLGKLTLLAQNEQQGWIEIPENSNITDVVRDLLLANEYDNLRITDSDARLRSGLTFKPQTPLLEILNALLEAAGYWSMTADGNGAFVAAPYVRPGDRISRYKLVDGENAIYVDDIKHAKNDFEIPNMFFAHQQETSDAPPLVGVAVNDDPKNPYSTVARGQVISREEEGLELATQGLLDAYAARKLDEFMGRSWSVELQHAPLPLDINDAVEVERSGTDITGLHTVQSITEGLDFDSDFQTNFRKVWVTS